MWNGPRVGVIVVVKVKVLVEETEGVHVGAGVAVMVGLGVGLIVGKAVRRREQVVVGVRVGTGVAVGTRVGVEEGVGLAVGTGVGVLSPTTTGVGVWVGAQDGLLLGWHDIVNCRAESVGLVEKVVLWLKGMVCVLGDNVNPEVDVRVRGLDKVLLPVKLKESLLQRE